MPVRHDYQLTKSWSATPWNPSHYRASRGQASPSGAGHRSRSDTMNKPVVLITGALTGIGRATAIAFAKDGARLVVSSRRETEGKALEAELRGLRPEAAFIQPDVRREDDGRELVDQTMARFGRLDA